MSKEAPATATAAAPGVTDVSHIEAPVTKKAYLMCGFAAFGGIFFGYDSGYISGVLGMPYFIHLYTGLPIPGPDATKVERDAFSLPASTKSTIVSVLSAGTFFGALIAGDLADMFGRRNTIVTGCAVFILGVSLQTASTGLALLVAGRLIAGFGVGFVSAIIILYMSEIAPKKVRGAIVSGYQWAITIGLFLASCVDYSTQHRLDTSSYRIPIGLQMLWALILGSGLMLLPESPRYYVKKGQLEKAESNLARLRGLRSGDEMVELELAEIVANHEYEMSLISQTGWFGSWANCFKGGLSKSSSNLRRTILGTSLQMMQQWTGANFIFYFGTTFFQGLNTISNPFVISLVTTCVNVGSTPLSFWIIEKYGRRPILIYGAIGMFVCEFACAVIGVKAGRAITAEDGTVTFNTHAVGAQISMICIYIFFFATTWGPGAWVVIGEIFPLPIRSRGVALSTASNWLWNCIITIITPYMVGTGPGEANLGSKVFFIWGALCTACWIYAYALIPETKGLTLEQVDRMMEESTPRESAKWVPRTTFAEHLAEK